MKRHSIFNSKDRMRIIRSNSSRYPWARKMAGSIIKKADFWLHKTDDELWALMFGSTLTRSWFVKSDGYCPSCGKQVPMYTWEFDGQTMPWKMRCPHCKDMFPKNDFHRFYCSGLDEHGIFRRELADKGLLYNCEYPDKDHPLHGFGVDDGNGYIENGKCWWFIGAYLVYAQWKQLVLGGIKSLANAYVASGDRIYAHKACIMLDRVADLFPDFSFIHQGVMYEEKPYVDGFVSYSVDHCIEIRELAEAYDLIFDAVRNDDGLVSFLSEKAERYKSGIRKSCFVDIQVNIERNLLELGISDPMKLDCNFPQEQITGCIVKLILNWPENRKDMIETIDGILAKATLVDGVTGEKGLASYAAWAVRTLAVFLSKLSILEEGFLNEIFKRHPRLEDTFRFHIDTWCLGRYYPAVGDTGWFAFTEESYGGAFSDDTKTAYLTFFDRNPGLNPSMFSFFGKVYEITGNPIYIQLLFQGNDWSLDNLPYDLSCDDPEGFRYLVTDVIKANGTKPVQYSINKQDWHIAILRSGFGKEERALWISYDSDGGIIHGHTNGMNIGLFAKGLDLMPDFGYLPVQFGGWFTPQAKWYEMTAAHNTVVVDGENHLKGKAGKTTLWADGKSFKAICVSGEDFTPGSRFYRTLALADISGKDSYILDIFRVAGGREHALFMHSHFGGIGSEGLQFTPTYEYGHGTLMRNFRKAFPAKTGWNLDWNINDYYGLLKEKEDIHLRYTGLTEDIEVNTAEAWINAGGYNEKNEKWIPCMMLRRNSDRASLNTTFTGIIEPFIGESNIVSIKKLHGYRSGINTCNEGDVCVEVSLKNGYRDIIISMENNAVIDYAESSGSIFCVDELHLKYSGELCIIRTCKEGLERIVICNGSYLRFGDYELKLSGLASYLETEF